MKKRHGRPYSGRLIFDHFPKTAGQAINAWLTDALGSATVNPSLITTHRALIAQSGTFPVLSAHVHFGHGEGLDPRFQYATVLREPIDRAISWLHFVIHNHAPTELPALHEACSAYLDSEGDDLRPILSNHLVNASVMHFAEILGVHGASDSELIDRAFDAIRSYDCVGVYERLGDFTAALATLIGIPAPPALPSVNVTASRPAADKVSEKLRDHLLSITDLDRALYERVAELVSERRAANPPRPPKKSRWVRYEREQAAAAQRSDCLEILAVRSSPEKVVNSGSVVRFEVEFELRKAVDRLQAGLHIFDDQKRWAFGVNNLLLGAPIESVCAGPHRIVYTLTADLPAGNYTIGFSFADVSGAAERNLFWQNETLSFEVAPAPGAVGVGYSHCYAEVVLEAPKQPLSELPAKVSELTT